MVWVGAVSSIVVMGAMLVVVDGGSVLSLLCFVATWDDVGHFVEDLTVGGGSGGGRDVGGRSDSRHALLSCLGHVGATAAAAGAGAHGG